MASEAAAPILTYRRDWGAALRALRRLLANGDDTVQVFRIMRALNAGSSRDNYTRLLATPEGGRIAYRRVELAQRLTDLAYVASFAPGTVGAGYRDFLAATGHSADGLADISAVDNAARDAEHPYAWFGRRERDIHDLWHVLTGYKADEHLGEACLVAFSYAQTGGLGWAAIALGAMVKSVKQTRGLAAARAIWEGYRHGRRAAWLSGEEYEALLNEPIERARGRLNIAEPVRYRKAQALLARLGLSAI